MRTCSKEMAVDREKTNEKDAGEGKSKSLGESEWHIETSIRRVSTGGG